MKLLYIHSGDDYAALTFEQQYGGRKVVDLLKDIDGVKRSVEYKEVEVDVIEVGDVDERFVKFLRDHILDYDQSKHNTFYLETETI
jgi:hypothetical protein